MFLEAKTSPPQPNYATLQAAAFAQIFDQSISHFIAPEGYLLTDSLQAILRGYGLPVVWLRLSLENCDPGMLLYYLATAVQQVAPQTEVVTLAKMRSHPGPIAGWQMLFTQLARDLEGAFPKGGVIVLEGLEALVQAPGTLHWLNDSLIAEIPPKIFCILISNGRLPFMDLPRSAHMIEIDALRLNEAAGLRLLGQNSVGLSPKSIQRAILLTGGRAAVLAGLVDMSQQLGEKLVQHEISQATSMKGLLTRLAKAGLVDANENSMQSLGLCLRLHYSPPPKTLSGSPEQVLPVFGPWLQPLQDGWWHMRGLWNRPLQGALHAWARPSVCAMHQAAENLAEQKALVEAIYLLFTIGDPVSAAGLIEPLAGTLMDLGLWATLKAWLNRLPEEVLEQWPWLLFISGKLDAVQGHHESARRTFAAATRCLSQQAQTKETCLSLLAESALAAWRGDITFASDRALTAHLTAQTAGLSLVQIWSAWQLGSLAASSGNMEEALGWFTPAGAAAESAHYSMVEVLSRAENLVRHQQELLRQRNYYQQISQDIDTAEKEVSARLRNLIFSVPENLDHLLHTHGWTQSPLLPISSAQIVRMPSETAPGLPPGILRALLNTLGFQAGPAVSAVDGLGQNAANLLDIPIPPYPIRESDTQAFEESTAPSAEKPMTRTPYEMELDSTARNELADETGEKMDLIVCMLGSFSLVAGGNPVADWSNNKCRALFRYLVFHHHHLTPKEILMEIFWPGASPESARNNLNVALHSIRRALPGEKSQAMIIYQSGAYRLNPGLKVWFDVEAFEMYAQAGHQLETAGQVKQAMKAYEAAIWLYRADFLSEEPYEEWTLPIRERLRILYLDTLDQLSLIHFNSGAYTDCITLCQRMLVCDNCREDVHSRLMRCYNRLGQDHLALRQYHICAQILRSELDLNPAPATTRLYDYIRSRGNA